MTYKEMHEIEMPVSVLLGQDMPIHPCIAYGCFHTMTAELRNHKTDRVACKG